MFQGVWIILLSMRKAAPVVAGTAWVVMVFCPSAGADPTLGHFVNVRTSSPPMRCAVASDDDHGRGPNVVCQTAAFPQAPLHQDQAIVSASGQFEWRTANLGMAPPGQPDITLVEGQSYALRGWTIAPTADGTRFTNDVTGHGMLITGDYRVTPF